MTHIERANDGHAESAESNLFRRQESTVVALNLLVLAGLFLAHQLFRSYLGSPPATVLFGIFGFFVAQTIEFRLLRTVREFSPRVLTLYPRVSVALKLLIGVWIAFAGDVEESHYAILVVLPVISAAFRFSLWGVIATAGAAGVLHITELRLYYLKHPPVMVHELYEAGTIVLIYYVVAVVVWSLSNQLRQDRGRLEASLTELQRTRDQLIKEEKLAAVGRLAGAIAHEIRNPVAMIKSTAEMVRRGSLSEPDRDEMCGILVNEGQRLERMTSDLLLYARTKAPEPRATPVADLLQYLASLARARSEETGHDVRVLAEDDSVLLVDPFQMQQALLNLLLNALQAAPPESPVLLGATVQPNGAPILFVENQGVPISEDAKARLFEPFFTTKDRGTGLGLAIARNIVRAHGGDLVLTRNDPDGVRFEVHLPLSAVVPNEPSPVMTERG